LRRFCPRLLSFPALIIGSLCPDAGYCFGGGLGGGFSHTLLGGLVFGLPLGAVLLALLYGLRLRAVNLLAAPYQRAFRPLCQQPAGSLWVLLVSLAIGIWSHLLWDSFTHTTGWLVQHLPVLQTPVLSVAGRKARVCHLLWYGCSFAGVTVLFLAFDKWRRTSAGGLDGASGKAALRNALLLAFMLLPMELAHHFFRGWLGLCFLAGVCLLLVAGLVLKMTAPGEGRVSGVVGGQPVHSPQSADTKKGR